MRLFIAIALALTTLGATGSSRSDPLASLRFLVGTWSCTYQQGTTGAKYTATFSYDLAGNWLRERDASSGAGGEALFTYQPKEHAWLAVFVEGERDVTLFKGTGSDAAHVVYRSYYPNATMSERVDHVSPTKYLIHFSQTAGGKTIKSMDVCVKS